MHSCTAGNIHNTEVHCFLSCVINLTSAQFHDDDVNILQKGVMHCFPPTNINQTSLNLAADLAIRIGPNTNVNYNNADIINKNPIPYTDRRIKQSLGHIRKQLGESNSILGKLIKVMS